MLKRLINAGLFLAAIFPSLAQGQSEIAAEPVVGLRDNRPRDYAFEHATVVIEPGRVLHDATILVEATTITAVGTEVEVPSGYMTLDCSGKTIYAGLIDAFSETDVPSPESPAYWNANVTPHRTAASVAAKRVEQGDKLRSQGITARLIAPAGGIVKGSSVVVLLNDSGAGSRLLNSHAWQHLQLTVPRSPSRARYPNSPMGAVALLRQSMYDATWYLDARTAYRAGARHPRPETNLALETLAEAIKHDTFVIDAPNERMAVRAGAIADEFSLQMIVRGSGREYRQLAEISALNRPVLVPVNFPAKPDVTTDRAARNTTLQDLMHWDLAPENPARLTDAGVAICLTTDGLENPADFLKQVRVAVKRGLDPDTALAAMTTTPARLLGIDRNTGRIKAGMLANLVIAGGDLFDQDTKILECWVGGEQFVITPPDDVHVSEVAGNWSLEFRVPDSKVSLQLELTEKDNKLSGTLTLPQESSDAPDDETDDPKPSEEVKLKEIVRERDRLTATVDLSQIDPAWPSGASRLTWVTIGIDATLDIFASITFPDGVVRTIEVRKIPDEKEAETNEQTEKPQEELESSPEQSEQVTENGTEDDETADSRPPDDIAAESTPEPTPILSPLGAYGLAERTSAQPTVMFRGATIWTCDETGTLVDADILIGDGRIAEIGTQLAVPSGCQIIDARGKHITPGLIDCHSHMGTDGGVNESGQAVTAEVRIGDFIDNSDINIYRQLAGGLTIANILHGSANPIGGQNQVIKLRWGESMDGLRMKEAPPGIKFALGENVKRNQTRYPNTRMGVEQIIRDQLLAARQYAAKHQRWREGVRDSLPPRIDLQLEAMAEVQQGRRWIHCHSYRQDEIIATLDVLEEFGIQIGTLQHILEGYKVADRMARHGAMGSAFSDWWAYKFEVFDAIPYNGALMHDRGVVVSFNSDDRELARRLNTEAAKATKYGGVPEEEALKFVTLNPARQLRIDEHVGSLAIGKHADLVVWNGRPLSTLSRCEQTWIDGKKYFDRQSELQVRQRDAALRARLIQKVLADEESPDRAEKTEVAEEDRWVRRDVFCATHGQLQHEHQGGSQ